MNYFVLQIQGCALKNKNMTDENKFDLINCLMSDKHPDAALNDVNIFS